MWWTILATSDLWPLIRTQSADVTRENSSQTTTTTTPVLTLYTDWPQRPHPSLTQALNTCIPINPDISHSIVSLPTPPHPPHPSPNTGLRCMYIHKSRHQPQPHSLLPPPPPSPPPPFPKDCGGIHSTVLLSLNVRLSVKGIVSFFFLFFFSVRTAFKGPRLHTSCKRIQRVQNVRYSRVQLYLVLSLCRRASIITLM